MFIKRDGRTFCFVSCKSGWHDWKSVCIGPAWIRFQFQFVNIKIQFQQANTPVATMLFQNWCTFVNKYMLKTQCIIAQHHYGNILLAPNWIWMYKTCPYSCVCGITVGHSCVNPRFPLGTKLPGRRPQHQLNTRPYLFFESDCCRCSHGSSNHAECLAKIFSILGRVSLLEIYHVLCKTLC
jgi:hypothetical protein